MGIRQESLVPCSHGILCHIGWPIEQVVQRESDQMLIITHAQVFNTHCMHLKTQEYSHLNHLQDETARVVMYENQSWLPVASLFGLVGCPVPRDLKAEIL